MLAVNIQQFGAIQERSFTFEQNKLTRISGVSGSGKTTICRAIYWAIYGQETNVIPLALAKSKPKNVPAVQVTYQELATDTSPAKYLSILRRKNSDQLLVFTAPDAPAIEGTAAQQIINDFWGPFEYSCGVYLAQEGACSFLDMNDKQKINFLTHIQYRNYRISQLRTAIEERQKAIKDQLKTNNGIYQHDLRRFTNELQGRQLQTPTEDVIITQWQQELEQLKLKLPQQQQQLAALNQARGYQQSRTQLLQRQQEIQAKLVTDAEWQELQQQIANLPVKINTPSTDLTKEQINTYLQQLTKWQQIANQAHLQLGPDLPLQLEILAQKRQEAREQKAQYQQMLQAIQPFASIQAYIEAREKYKAETKEFRHLQQLPSYDELVNSRREALLSKERFELALQALKCPACHTKLNFSKGQLVIANDLPREQIEQNLQKINIWLAKANKQEVNIKRKSELVEILERKKRDWLEPTTVANYLEIDKAYQEWQNFHCGTWQWPVELDAKALGYQIPQLQQLDKDLTAAKVYHDFVRNQGETPDQIKSKYQEQAQFRQSLEEVNRQLSVMQTIDSTIDVDALATEVNNGMTRSHGLHDCIRQAQENNRLYQQQQVLTQERTQIQQLEALNQYWANIYDKLIKLINDRLQNMVDIFNYNLNHFLQPCFPDRQVKSELHLTQTLANKSVKQKVNLYVELDGLETNCKRLSKGERSRLNLALVLTFSRLVASPVLIIDEILSSLNPEYQMDIMQQLRDYIPSNKVCIITDHHAPAGFFDADYRISE